MAEIGLGTRLAVSYTVQSVGLLQWMAVRPTLRLMHTHLDQNVRVCRVGAHTSSSQWTCSLELELYMSICVQLSTRLM